jgi:hypothetical protein
MKAMLIKLMSGVVILVVLLGWIEWRSQSIADQVVRTREREDFAYWKKALLPVYDATRTSHVPDPKTKNELFDPLVRLISPVEGEILSTPRTQPRSQ